MPGPGGRIFATIPAGGQFAHVFVDEQEARATAAELPDAFSELWWGKTLSGLKADLAAAPADRLRELVEEAWRRRAPKKLQAELDK